MRERLRFLLLIGCGLLLGAFGPSNCPAGVVVLTNRTAEEVPLAIGRPDGNVERRRVAPGEVTPIAAADTLTVAFSAAGEPRSYRLRTNNIYFFAAPEGKLDLLQFGLPAADDEASPPAVEHADVVEIPVMLMVDQMEPAAERVWQKRLRDRLEAASEVFERACRVRFRVASVGTWDSGGRGDDITSLLREFEQEVEPAPARLALGFTGQLDPQPDGRRHVGGTRYALQRHILIREWHRGLGESQRLEMLVHELGHFLGATHSSEQDSVMRTVYDDARSNARDFRIGFDALNTLIINQVAEELREGPRRGLHELNPGRKALLRRLYLAMNKSTPEEQTALRYLALLRVTPASDPPEAGMSPPATDGRNVADALPANPAAALTEATRRVMLAMTEAAADSRPRGAERFANGDRRTELCVRRAAEAAAKLPPEYRAKAFLMALGLGLDHSRTLRDLPKLDDFCRQVESDAERARRLRVLGSPTMGGRRDLAQHFSVSAALTAMFGPSVANTAGLAKELRDAQGGSGFSFVDLAADMAGVRFASAVLDGRLELAALAVSFRVDDVLPPTDGLEEGIGWEDFQQKYARDDDGLLQARQQLIERRLDELPAYRP